MKSYPLKKVIQSLTLSFAMFAPLAANTTRDIGSMPKLEPSVINRWILFYTNIERVKNNMPPLEYDTILEKAADWQAGYCANDLGDLSHYSRNPEMSHPGKRINHFGGTWSTYGENITVVFATNSESVRYYSRSDEKGTYKDYGNHTIYWRNDSQIAYSMVDSWMNSSGHRANILNRSFCSMGGGSCAGKYSGQESWYGAQVFTGNSKIDFKTVKAEKKESGYQILYKGQLAVKCFELADKTVIKDVRVSRQNDIYICELTPDLKGEVFVALADGEIVYPVLKLK